METAPLRSFATSARAELIREVGARIIAVLAQGSPERVEQPKTVSVLERVIAGAGGGEKGKAHVADKVAYTWFNRIIALRFMDANGYTGMGVVSPAADQVGQPEVLAAAKRGQIDKDVIREANSATITGLLNGTRQPRLGVDAQAEAYALLLADYCRFWNAALPFMFEREGDYTELLIPANLLAEDSVLSRSVAVLTEAVCQDVEVIGWLYQFYISERKDEVFAGFKKNKKAGADEIPAATQLFTPHWIVRYLVENSLGRLWMLNRPNSGLASLMDYYIAPIDEETDFLKMGTPEELKIIDPACGSGHMLTYAFDLLYSIYEEEGYAPSEIPGLILANNLYGTEIDPRAGALAAFALTMKATAKRKLFLKDPVEPNVCVLVPITFQSDELTYLVTPDGDRHAEEAFWNQFSYADTFGSLITPAPSLTTRLAHHLETIDDDGDLLKANALDRARQVIHQAELLSPGYAVVVANPPYMGIKSMNGLLSEFAKAEFKDSKADLFAMFIERCLALTLTRGVVGMITMQSWMFLSSFENLRLRVLEDSPPAVMAHLGNRAFDSIGGSVVSTTAFVLVRGRARKLPATYFRVVDGGSEAAKEALVRRCLSSPSHDLVSEVTAEAFEALPGSPIAYWLPEKVLSLVRDSPSITETLTPRQGLFTTDNGLFLRYFWEVSSSRTCLGAGSDDEALASGARWFAHNKGGANRKWFGNYEYVVDWEDLGARIKAIADEKYPYLKGNVGLVVHDDGYYFRPAISWSEIGGTAPAFRAFDAGFTFNIKGMSAFTLDKSIPLPMETLAVLNSPVVRTLAPALNPTMSFGVNNFRSLPHIELGSGDIGAHAAELVEIARLDWDSYETSWHFRRDPLVAIGKGSLRSAAADVATEWDKRVARAHMLEIEINGEVLTSLGLEEELSADVDLREITLMRNPSYRYKDGLGSTEARGEAGKAMVADLVSYAVGCMFGRYSLDQPGLILADQGATLQDYLAKVPTPSFAPDPDNVIPIVDGDWFEDDVVGFFRRFLRAAFGDQHFEENLKFVAESLGVRTMREYFITRGGKSKFYDDHVQRYKKRPIYWLFSSPKGAFNALVYMHRYTPSTVSTVLTYLREYVTKLESSLQQADRAGNAKEADRIRKILVELNEYEHATLFPKASENLIVDLDDGVKTNYPKFGAALRKVTGLGASVE